ncbi:N-acetylmuramoyl-L-alanine amidase [Roseiarcus fermentans]|uniref:N-acetylmuramoyl-L-alanine amidase n=1 Tax=Roseiarcus fermentans TaxID=1473586 RepID=A0A366FLT8_9HYPH|nr:N-acetylmuramoyl-L-alanine amidase [Roseiarcus fermentans]RBP15622.1 N-acetylmuramoyl-L-alanine amidase [Roseiarcus fermentans]
MTSGPVCDSPLASAFLASPNFGDRRGAGRPNAIVLHYTGMPTAEAALALLVDPASQVSAHYLVHEDGRIVQLVAERDRAWHAGKGLWKGDSDLNSASVGIEIVNPGHDGGAPPFSDAQIDATIALCRDIGSRWTIPAERVLAHSDIAPTRKRDPGEVFPWRRLFAAGVGHWVEPAPVAGGPLFRPGEEGPPVRALQALLALYGYGVELSGVCDRHTRAVVTAFQRHFRPALVDGDADASTVATLKALIEGLAKRRP